MAKFDVATSYLALATFSGVWLYLQNYKCIGCLNIQDVRCDVGATFTCNSDLFSKFVLLAGRSTRITVKVFHEGGPKKWS